MIRQKILKRILLHHQCLLRRLQSRLVAAAWILIAFRPEGERANLPLASILRHQLLRQFNAGHSPPHFPDCKAARSRRISRWSRSS